MLHPSGYSVYYESERLLTASPSKKSELLGAIVDGILENDICAGNTAYWLGRDLAGIPEKSEPGAVSSGTETSHGKFSAANSLKLVRDVYRLRGFITAIKRWPGQEVIMDVGCGAFPILALAAAMYHPKAEITALEINQDSADATDRFIRLFGLDDRVQTVNADIAHHPIDPNTTAAVTETFSPALQGEPGPKIVRLLHAGGVPIITPSTAKLCLRMPQSEFFQEVDLRHDAHASIAFKRSPGDKFAEDWYSAADIRAAYYDDFGLVLAGDADAISRGLPFKEKYTLDKLLTEGAFSGRLTYELGHYPFEPGIEAVESHSPALP